MKYSARLMIVALIPWLLMNWSANNAKGEPGEGTAGDSTYTGNSYLAYAVDGRQVAIKDYLHRGNNNLIVLFLNEVKNNVDAGIVKIDITNELTHEVFNFSVANKGRSTISHYKPSVFNFNNKKLIAATYMSPKYHNYYGDSVTVNITDMNTSHVAGTFSGKFMSDDNKESIRISDGKFDLMFTRDNMQ